MQWYLIAFLLICNSLMVYDIAHLFVCLLFICISLVRYIIIIFKLGCFFSFQCVLRVIVYFGFIRYVFCKYFLPICHLSFNSINNIFGRKVFTLKEVQRINFPSRIMILVLHLKLHHQISGSLDFLLCYFLEVLQFFAFTVVSMISFKLVFVKSVNFGSRFIFLHMNIQFQHHLLKRKLFLIELPMLFYQRSVEYIRMCLFLSFLFCFHYLSVLVPALHCL